MPSARARPTVPRAVAGLSPTLRRLVGLVEAALGRVVAEAEGESLYHVVETVRRDMVAVREGRAAGLTRARSRLGALTTDQRTRVARAYTVYLELANVCENAYRTSRLRARSRETDDVPDDAARVVFVLTAHPTESRSPTNIRLLRRIQSLLVDALERQERPDADRLRHLLRLVWATGTHPAHRPTVEDEARHLFSLLDDPILEELLRLHRAGDRVRFRTWVGGDKDGHPGVGPEETGRSLAASRQRLLAVIERRLLPEIGEDVALIPEADLEGAWRALQEAVQALRTVTIGDGRLVARLRELADALATIYAATRGAPHPRLDDLQRLLELFPGLVMPLELREARGLFQRQSVIADMLRFVRDVARGGDVGWYVAGCVVSMTDQAEDLWDAQTLVTEVLGEPLVPIVPLFELPSVLPRATAILERALTNADYAAAVRRQAGVEVMLGYSDTSKRMGVLASRLAIHDAMRAVGAWADRRGLRVVFFHGSGGSVGRGGGSIADQAATWPAGAMAVVKQTLQGEMVERTLATPEIFRSQVRQIARVQAAPPRSRRAGRITRQLARRSEHAYVTLVETPGFFDLLRRATPYARLATLNIGSRPVARAAGRDQEELESLRAIPWVLCWTQTRYLLHAWLGVGTAWREVRDDPVRRGQLLRALRRDPLLSAYVRQLGFTLAKTAPAIWRTYVTELVGAASPLVRRLERERQDALDLARQLSTDGELLADRPWLGESIHYRAPMIHPLNLIQIDVLTGRRLTDRQALLLRETATGIAAGMLTTG